MPLTHIAGNSYFIEGPVSTGVYIKDSNAYLIDTGIDDDSARKILKLCLENKAEPSVILNTHSHADHCGGNAFIRKRHTVSVYAPKIESFLIEAPLLEPSYLFGAAPFKELRQKFLMAKPSKVDYALTDETVITIGGEDFGVCFIPGHSIDMMAITTPDHVCYLGDGLFGLALLEKHPLLFIYDYHKTVESLEKIKSIDANFFVLAHGGIVEKEKIDYLVNQNRDVLVKNHSILYDILSTPMNEIELHKKFVEKMGINESIPQYYLNLSVVKAHLSAMIEDGVVKGTIEQGTLIYSYI